jgi:arabinogalactan endo-1,4-beta-galactosidase
MAMRKILFVTCALVLAVTGLRPACAQSYAIGADVSFLGKCEQDGVVFKEGGQPKDVLAILHEHQYNWVRLRLFHDPSVGEGHLPNDLAYTLRLTKRAHAMGFHVLLDLHYSDTWADPGKQFTPAAWSSLNHKQLAGQVFSYTRDVIAAFAREGLMPDMVQVGNEITNGMLWPDGKLPDNWDNFADLVKAGIRGVRAGTGSAHRPQIMIHIERSGDYSAATAFFDNLIAHKIRFDVIGMSYYPRWHGDIATMRVNLSNLALRYHLPIIVAEAAFNWKPVDFIGKKSDFEESPEGQKAFLQAVDAAVRAIPNGLGQGVFWWEPAAEGGLRSRSFFDDDGNVLPVISAFDNSTSR